MSEKRGEVEKLINDYNTAGVLEVNIKGHWYRTTSRYFRSFNGERRITAPNKTIRGDVWSPEMITETYYGPLYRFNTNKIVNFTNNGKTAL